MPHDPHCPIGELPRAIDESEPTILMPEKPSTTATSPPHDLQDAPLTW
jgi:hypothetical protein